MIGKLFRLLLDSILPRRCRKCGQILTIEGELCEKCLNELNFIFPPYCRKCGHPLSEKEARGKMLCASCLRKSYTGLPVDCFSLVRHRKTRPQVEFSGFERVRNVKNAFSVPHPEKLAGKRVVLIDDVLTTGSTLKECAAALKKAGVRSVDALTVARVC